MSLIKVLFIQSLSDSLEYRFYLDQVESSSLLEWWLDTVSADSAPGPIDILCEYEGDRFHLSHLLKHRREVTVIRPQHSTQLPALIELAKVRHARHLALIPIGYVLAPKDLLRKMYQHHITRTNDFTIAERFPSGITPAILNSDLVLSLEEYQQVPGLPRDPVVLLQRLKFLSETAGEKPPISLNSVPFDTSMAFQFDTRTLPLSLRIETSGDVEILRRVRCRLASNLHDESEVLALQLWKEEATLDACKSRAKLKASAGQTDELEHLPVAPKVLYVSNPSAFSGAQQSLCDLVSHTNSRMFEKFALLGMEGYLAQRLREAGAMVTVRPTDFSKNTVDNFLYAASLLRSIRPSILHLNSLADGVPLLSAATLFGIPIVQHLHIAPTEVFEEYLRSADVIIAVSEFVRREALRFNIPKEKVHLIYNGIDPDQFRKDAFSKHEVRRDLGIPLDSKVVLVTARFTPQKRHDLLLKAAAIVRASIPSLHLLLNGEAFGEQEYLDSIRRQASNLGLSSCITWIGFVADIRPPHVAADLLVLCSNREALGRCVVEAMAMELPAVVTDSGGNPEVIKHLESGFVVKDGDADALAHTIVQALTQDRLCENLTRAARHYVEEHLTAAAQAQRVMEIYGGLIASNSSTSPTTSRPPLD